ncbi:MAG: DoxX family protein [Caldilineaceae bacterium]|nr:DoxX family protein [Caldilineaceae bacterium]
MNIILWIIQILLAAAFGMAGFTKLSQPIDALSGMMPWVAAVPLLLVRFIGVAEIAGALGLILPWLTKIQPRLTALAAVGLALVMILGAAFHATRGEFGNIGANVLLLVLLAFVAWGRWSRTA